MTKSDFLLSENENEDIFRNDILPKYFPNPTNPINRKSKTAFYLAGQPGSGKTTVRKEILKQYADPSMVVVLNTDELREHHPKYNILQSDPNHFKEAPVLVNEDSNKWFQKLLREAVLQGKDLIFDTTLGSRDLSGFKNGMQQLQEKGYKLELHVLSVPEQVSKLGIHLRYESQKEKKGSGRFVKMETHDLNYKMLPENVKSLLEDKTFANVSVYKKEILRLEDGNVVNNRVEVIYDSKNDGLNVDKVLDKLEVGRKLEFSKLEKEYFKKRIQQVESYKSNPIELSEFRKDTAALIKCIGDGKNKSTGLTM